MNKTTIPALLKFLLQTRALGQGIFPIQADKRRGIYQATFQYLQDRQMLSQQWAQGQVLLYLPEFQDMMLQEAQEQGCFQQVRDIIQQYQIPELLQIQREARSIDHTNPAHQYTDQDCGWVIVNGE